MLDRAISFFENFTEQQFIDFDAPEFQTVESVFNGIESEYTKATIEMIRENERIQRAFLMIPIAESPERQVENEWSLEL